MKINQKIYGGNQQFADKIVNYSSALSESDKKIVELISADSQNQYDSHFLEEQIKKVKSSDTKPEEKEAIKGTFKKILDSGLTQLVKEAVTTLITQNAEYLNFP